MYEKINSKEITNKNIIIDGNKLLYFPQMFNNVFFQFLDCGIPER